MRRARRIGRMASYEPVPASRRDEFRATQRQAFHPESGPAADESDDGPWPPALFAPRGVVAGDDLAAVCNLYDLEATVRGEWTAVGGFGGVATRPEHRRQGHARHLLCEALREYRADGVDLTVLWPASVPFYRGLGWGTASRELRATVPPEQLQGLDAPPESGAAADRAPGAEGRVRQLDVEDWERLRPVETARARRFGLSLRRSETWWRERTLAAWPDEPAPYAYGLERDGDLAGYVLLRFQPDDGRRLVVRDLAGVDRPAERALLAFLGDHDSQAAGVELSGPLARELLELVSDPATVDIAVDGSEGPMVRLTDVERGLASLSWPAAVEATLTLLVDDPLLDANDGVFEVAVADGDATVRRAPEAAVDVALGVGALSRLAVGAIDVDRAVELGAIDVRRDPARDELAAAFPTEPVYLREFF